MPTENAAPAHGIISKRYTLHERIGAGGMGTVYRATDRLSGQMVALKQVTAPTQQLMFTSRSGGADLRLALAQEFKVLASMRHPHIISVLDYGFSASGNGHGRQPFFTMELLANPHTIQEVGRSLDFEGKIRLLEQLLQAIAYLHRRGIIHRDIKPSNVLVGESGVKVLDFGLSMTGDNAENRTGTTAGTLAYMAPEVLQGIGASQSSDLYAVGVIAYELLAGEHPFQTDDMTQLLTSIVTTPVDVSKLDVDVRVALLLERLLAKSPDARFTDASRVITLLDEATERPILLETAATRESFLQSARLVGREAELQVLSDALDSALIGQGSAWLIGGESGVGKSRLLDELRTHALVKGATVVRGQGISEGGSLYQLWRPALRWLCLLSDLDPADASILKPLVPDINDLLSYEVPDAPPEANPQAAQERLLGAIETLFRSLNINGKSLEPMVIILEDLHWASESVELLASVHASVRELPLLLIGSFRDDEAPNLPDKLPGMPILKLERLTSQGIAELSEAMLGRAGSSPEVVSLLERETEGNVFFLVEVVRALAEEAGGLNQIGLRTLPQQVFAGGVRRIVRRRLERMPRPYFPLLQTAAVLGRQLDLNVLQHLAGDIKLTDWLTTGADSAVLDVQEDVWRFAHDKLREGVLEELTLEEDRLLHEQVAEAIEAVYPDSPEQAAILAHHWAIVGNDEKYTHYAMIAGNQAMGQGVNSEAAAYYSRAIAAMSRLPETDDLRRSYIDTAIKLTRVGAYTVRGEGTKNMLESALAYANELGDEIRQARVLANIGTFYYVSGRYAEAFPYFNQVIERAEKLGLEELLLLPYNFIGRSLILAGDLPHGQVMLEKGIPLAEKFNDLDLLSGSIAFHGCARWTQGDIEQGNIEAVRALEVAEQLGHPSRISGTLITTAAGLCYLGRFDEALIAITRGLDIAKETGDLQPLYAGNAELGYVYINTGKVAEGIPLLDFALGMAQRANLLLNLPFYQAWRALADVYNGNAQAAIERCLGAVELGETSRQITAKAEALWVLSKACLALSAPDLEQAEDAIRKSISIHNHVNAQVMVAKATFQQAEVYAAQGRRDDAIAKFDEAAALFERFGMTYYLNELRNVRGMM